MSSSSPYTYVYHSIVGIASYVDFVYTWNWISTFTLFTFLYTIPGTCVFLKIVHFYWRHGNSKVTANGLKVEIFQSFLLMQLFNIFATIFDFIMIRIPSTTMLTSYCAAENPQRLIKLSVFFYYWTSYSAHAFSVMFCVLRVAVLYFAPKRSRKEVISIATPLTITLAIIVSLPHILSEGYCVQLFEPYPFGSLLFISRFHYDYIHTFVLCNMLVLTLCTFVIALLNISMMVKLRQRRFQIHLRMRTATNSKAERTLTGTMIILLVPLMLSQLIALGEMFHFEILSYLLLFRPIFADVRVHVVSAYFYLTHPLFKKKTLDAVIVSITHVL